MEAHYRAADIHLSAVGTLVDDTGKSVFVEERFSQNGKQKTMRVEIPYEYVIRIAEVQPRDPVTGSPARTSAGSAVRSRP